MAGFLSSSLSSCLPSLLLLLQLSSSYAGQFRVIGPGHPIRALVGDEVELPCRISPGRNATGMEVGWYRPPFSRVVHLYRNGKDQDGEQAPEYRGRTELLKGAIGEGKVTLRIRNVRFSDEGGFTCFFRDHSYQEEAAMELKVEDPFYWVSPGVLAVIAVLPVLLLQVSVGLVFLCLQHRLRGKLRAEIENLHRTFGQFLEELSKFSPPSCKLRTKQQGSGKRKRGAGEGWKPEERRGWLHGWRKEF
ncbi:PREDICTED: myelin-oligodendrocyte glycoprotein isoform X2 [Hipposideros armiger]|uniref:Myelin-oligodendrocyte glycoprotein n=1 Tax=Hipposideros armiger TaxID=186990 RepID=A0A8B7QMC5_HIPAR|nr:PREDICTED: myelin-oligodendrocyte glycoprotein isoform X2 [Hipposideros armiger]